MSETVDNPNRTDEPPDVPTKMTVDTRDWLPFPAPDASDFLGGPLPQYLSQGGER